MHENTTPTSTGQPAPAATAASPAGRPKRLPSTRASVALAAVMLAIGVSVGAAIGPTPATSLAGSSGVVQQLPSLIAALAARQHAQAAAQPAPTAVQPPAITAQSTPTAASAPASATSAPAASTTPSTTAEGESKTSGTTPTKSGSSKASNLPPVTSVWLIELSGVSFAEALATPAGAPYITGELLPKATLLSGWSALSASAFANDALLAEHKAAVGGAPPLLHTIVQPPCPEGPAGAACAAGTPGQLASADAFLKATLATITATTTFSEHGLVVVTFATVADPTASELPAGAASATLTSTPPAGAVLLSPFVKAGARSTTTFNPTSPKQGLEKLLH